MNRISCFLITGLVSILLACSNNPPQTTSSEDVKEVIPDFLPFKKVPLNDLSEFKATTGNWQIAGDVYADRNTESALEVTEGVGILANIPTNEARNNIFTNLEHGNFELELDVMMPKGSNSGIYFQSRYEVQLFDSWGQKDPHHSDIGGIYQRWDDSRGKGNEGYEGHAPRVNASKTPGLWQHFKIIFIAPKFDGSGKKIENAKFEKVWLNGVLIQENVELLGTTRSAAFTDEVPKAPLMLQGDHGPVAFRNIQYKMYDGQKVTFSELDLKEYESSDDSIPDFTQLTPIKALRVDSITYAHGSSDSKYALVYQGELNIPNAGDYLFKIHFGGAGGQLIVDGKMILDMQDGFYFDQPGIAKTTLAKGSVPFTLVYNKPSRHWRKGFALFVEGAGIKQHPLHAPSSTNTNREPTPIIVTASDEPVLQRCFMMIGDEKRTHVIAVATPEGIHYAYDLQIGALLHIWDGEFLDVTQMWHQRGEPQLGVPAGASVALHGDPDFAFLEGDAGAWPDSTQTNVTFKQIGYELNDIGLPTFSYQFGDLKVTNEFIPRASEKRLNRKILLSGNADAFFKVAEGEIISQLPDGAYGIDDKSYYIDFPAGNGLEPQIRKSDGMDELIVKIPSGTKEIAYDIIW
ncbi:MAG: DUF1080 domain-containing protein [Flammeovirgaceae bacterium]|nr:DUF1080 domain-containing protein [Flammeovirgaceae bacterium]